jgi:hypothetical protein
VRLVLEAAEVDLQNDQVAARRKKVENLSQHFFHLEPVSKILFFAFGMDSSDVTQCRNMINGTFFNEEAHMYIHML